MDWFWQEDGPLALLPWLPSLMTLWLQRSQSAARRALGLQCVMILDDVYRIHDYLVPAYVPGGVLAQGLVYLLYLGAWTWILRSSSRLKQTSMRLALALLGGSVVCDGLADVQLARAQPLEQPLKWAGLLAWAWAWRSAPSRDYR